MSVITLQAVIGRAVQDIEFRSLLLRDPAQALAGYELSAGEREALTTLTPEHFDGSNAELEARLSHSIVWGDITTSTGPTPGVVWGN